MLPYPPKALTAKASQSTSITVYWSHGFDGYSATLRYILDISRKTPVAWRQYTDSITASRLNFTVSGLEPYTVYMLRMKSVNAIGQSSYSSLVEARTLEDGMYVI